MMRGGRRAPYENPDEQPISTLARRIEEEADAHGLSKREREVLELLVEGRTATYIAERQFVSPNTVRTHIKRIYAKMGVSSRQELLDVVHGR